MRADPAPAPEAQPTTTPDTTRRDLLVLSAVTVLLRLPILFAPKHLTFDDGVFGASAVAMRNGGVPFREVFSSQGPLFLPLVWLADLVGLHTLNGPRLLNLASGVVLVCLLYLAGRELSGADGARLAGGVAAITGGAVAVTGPVAADGPAMAFAAAAVLVSLRYRRGPTLARAIAIGACTGAAIMVKALVLPVAIPVGLILLWGRRPVHWVAAVGTSIVVGAGLSLLWGWDDVWDQSVTYHLDAPGSSAPGDNLVKVLNTFATRDMLLLGAGVVALGWVLLRRRRGEPPVEHPDQGTGPHPALLLWAWFLAMALTLVVEHPLWRPHVSELVPPAALLLAWYRPPWKGVAVVGGILWVISLVLYTGPELLWAGDYEGDEAAVVEALRNLPEGALAISDEPGQVWRSGHRTPDAFVDASALLTDSGRVTGERLAEAAADPRVCAVVVWSDRYGHFEDLPDLLAAEGYEVAQRFDDTRVLYERGPEWGACSPGL